VTARNENPKTLHGRTEGRRADVRVGSLESKVCAGSGGGGIVKIGVAVVVVE
jgi:hypothetical protein